MTVSQVIQNEALELMDTLASFQARGLKEINKNFDTYPAWRRYLIHNLAIAVFCTCVVASIVAVNFLAIPLKLCVYISFALVTLSHAFGILTIYGHYDTKSFDELLTYMKENIFITSKRIPRDSQIALTTNQIDSVVKKLKKSENDDWKEYRKHCMRLLPDLPTVQAIKMLSAASVIMHLLIAIQLIQRQKVINDEIKKHISHIKTNLNECRLSLQCKAQINSIAEYLEKTTVFTFEKNEASLSDPDSIYAIIAAS